MKSSALLGLLLVLFMALGMVYSWVIPLYEGPDEYAHLKYVGYLRQEKELPKLDEATAHISHELVQQPPLFYALAAAASAWLPVDVALANAEVDPYVDKNLSHRAYLTLPDAPVEGTWAVRAARMVSLLGAMLALLGTWLLVRRLLPQMPWAAYVAVVLVGFNPQFLFSAATITNDTWAAALPVWALWLALGAEDAPHPWRVWLGAGMIVGAAALTKYSALVVVVPLGIVCLVQLHRRGWRAWRYLVQSAASAALGLALVAGWWFVRNWLAVGEAIPLAHMIALQPDMAWAAPLAWGDESLWRGVRWLLRSYWGVFGYGIIAPAAYHGVVQNMLLVSLAGYAVWAARWIMERHRGGLKQPGLALLLAGSWFVMAFFGLLNWMRVMRFTDQGRLLFPAAPALAIFILLGWAAWLPRRIQPWGALAAVALMVALGFSQVETLRAAYAMPPGLREPVAYDRAVEARFDAGMTLLGIDLPNGAALEPGEALPITFYWTTREVITGNYTLFIHLADRENRLLYQFDGVPYNGRHPTRQWLPGQRFADPYTLTVAKGKLEGDAGELATLSVGFYPYDAINRRQIATALATGEPLGDRILLATVRLHANSDPLPFTKAPVARWQKGIELAAQSVTLDAQGVPHRVTLRWQASQVVHQDYTVFVQLLDAGNQVMAQVDRQPQQGQWPTSTWRNGDVIEDQIDLPPPSGQAVDQWSQLIVGLYDQSGRRLEVVEPSSQGYFTLLRAE
ncbi:MAG: glycosyltransferase family 39 protein [Caldilineaceae bacterium]|nr:glycosyltransferase family 39 protein [Caldilineaceae bacterium]